MARIRIVLEDDDGREMAGTQARVYELGRALGTLHEIEGALEQFRHRALPELTAELLAEAQEAALKDQKKAPA